MRAARVWGAFALTGALAVSACSDDSTAPSGIDRDLQIAGAKASKGTGSSATEAAILEAMNLMNTRLEAGRADYRVAVAEYLTDGSRMGGVVRFLNDRGNKQLGHHFVPNDPRRGGAQSISWLVDLAEGATTSGLSAAGTDAAINRAMQTWQDVTCSAIPLSDLGSFAFDFGVVQNIVGFGGIQAVFADVTHAGWLPREFFDAIAPPDGGDFILGVTFTFLFIDGNGDFTDVNNDGKLDTAFREIYYNDMFTWGDGSDFDVETVALHEAGHGLSQAHFGTAFLSPGNGALHFAPRAVMNAAFSGVQTEILATDNAGHCSIWSSWPMN